MVYRYNRSLKGQSIESIVGMDSPNNRNFVKILYVTSQTDNEKSFHSTKENIASIITICFLLILN